MSGANLTNLIVGVVVLVLFLSLQLATRRLSESYRLPIILGVIGIVQLVNFLKGHPDNDGGFQLPAIIDLQ